MSQHDAHDSRRGFGCPVLALFEGRLSAPPDHHRRARPFPHGQLLTSVVSCVVTIAPRLGQAPCSRIPRTLVPPPPVLAAMRAPTLSAPARADFELNPIIATHPRFRAPNYCTITQIQNKELKTEQNDIDPKTGEGVGYLPGYPCIPEVGFVPNRTNATISRVTLARPDLTSAANPRIMLRL